MLLCISSNLLPLLQSPNQSLQNLFGDALRCRYESLVQSCILQGVCKVPWFSQNWTASTDFSDSSIARRLKNPNMKRVREMNLFYSLTNRVLTSCLVVDISQRGSRRCHAHLPKSHIAPHRCHSCTHSLVLCLQQEQVVQSSPTACTVHNLDRWYTLIFYMYYIFKIWTIHSIKQRYLWWSQ